jgi:hypothetical protein
MRLYRERSVELFGDVLICISSNLDNKERFLNLVNLNKQPMHVDPRSANIYEEIAP